MSSTINPALGNKPQRGRPPAVKPVATAPIEQKSEHIFDADEFLPEESKQPMPVAQPRSPLNHALDNSISETIGGMQFSRDRRTMDYSSKMVLDIPKNLLNNELSYRWVNDSNGRVDKVRSNGYEIVDNLGDAVTTRVRVGTNKDGSGLFAVLMATPKKWHEERKQSVDKEISNKERGLLSGKEDDLYNKGSKIER